MIIDIVMFISSTDTDALMYYIATNFCHVSNDITTFFILCGPHYLSGACGFQVSQLLLY